MLFAFDPSAIRAELKTEGDHWVVAIEMGTGSWSHAETSWRYQFIPRDEIRNAVGDDSVPHSEDVVAYIETGLRRAGWRAVRQGKSVSPPVLEVWDVSPASETVRPYHLFHGHHESADPQD
jgi:hypothetical protein